MRLGSISSRPAAVAAGGLVGTHLETRCMSGRWLAQCLLFSCLYWEASNSGDDRLGPTADPLGGGVLAQTGSIPMPRQPLDGRTVGSNPFKIQSAKQSFVHGLAPAFTRLTQLARCDERQANLEARGQSSHFSLPRLMRNANSGGSRSRLTRWVAMLRLLRLPLFRSWRDENSRHLGLAAVAMLMPPIFFIVGTGSRASAALIRGKPRSIWISSANRGTDQAHRFGRVRAANTLQHLGTAHSVLRTNVWSRSAQTSLTRSSNRAVRPCSQINASSLIAKCLEYRAFT